MNIDVGDLVLRRKNNLDLNSGLGIVVKKINSNCEIKKSIHTNHIINSYPPVFYVYFCEKAQYGHYLRSDLLLQQSFMKDYIIS